MHTAFFDSRESADAAYLAMQRHLVILTEIDDDTALYAAMDDFVSRY